MAAISSFVFEIFACDVVGKISRETADDTLLAADLAEDSGKHDAAETAYRRVLAGDPKSVASARPAGPSRSTSFPW